MKREPADEVTNGARPHTLSRRLSTVRALHRLPREAAAIIPVMTETGQHACPPRSFCSAGRGGLKVPEPRPRKQVAPTPRPIAAISAIADFAEPNAQNRPGLEPAEGSLTLRPWRIGDAATAKRGRHGDKSWGWRARYLPSI